MDKLTIEYQRDDGRALRIWLDLRNKTLEANTNLIEKTLYLLDRWDEDMDKANAIPNPKDSGS